jgi:hypothetical protein
MARQVHCHKMVAETARGMAEAVYEELARDNDWYKMNPDRAVFIEAAYGSLIAQARQVLAKMLESLTVAPEQKELIFEALVLDKSLKGGRDVIHRVATIN